jgi:hypothetical protein
MWRFSGTGSDAKNALWDSIIATDGHFFRHRVVINSVTYNQPYIVSMETSYGVFADDTPSVGACLAGELTLSIYAPSVTIPRMATVNPFVRVEDGTNVSDWLPQGKFFIDSRELTQNEDGMDILSLHCYDAMLKSEADFPSVTDSLADNDINTVKRIANGMGLQSSVNSTAGIDSRTVALIGNSNHGIGRPIGYSMREVLSKIATIYGGNWIISYSGQLYLVPLNGIPPSTNYLITQDSHPITFGGVRILV